VPFRQAKPFLHIMRVHLAHVLIMRAFMRNIMRGVRWIMRAGLLGGIARCILGFNGFANNY